MMSDFPTNPSDVAAQLTTTGDEWIHEPLADALNAEKVIASDAILYFLEPDGSLGQFSNENLDDLNIVWVGFADENGNPEAEETIYNSARDAFGSVAILNKRYDSSDDPWNNSWTEV